MVLAVGRKPDGREDKGRKCGHWFRRLVDEFLTAEVGLAYLRDNGSPILKSLRKFLIDLFQRFSPESERLGHRARQMALF
jgi:hypothetical protein